jgi:hypothetical protein
MIRLSVWDDPLANGGLRADSDDALVYLTPILGPTSTLVLHRLARCLTANTMRAWTCDELAATFGVRPALLRSSLARLERFGMIRIHGEHIDVRTSIPALAARQIERMPAYLAATCPYQVRHTNGHAA